MKTLEELLFIASNNKTTSILFNKNTLEFCRIDDTQVDMLNKIIDRDDEYTDNILRIRGEMVYSRKQKSTTPLYRTEWRELDSSDLDSDTLYYVKVIINEVIPNPDKFKLSSFENGKPNNIYFLDKKIEKELPNNLSIKEFIKKTFRPELDYYNRPRIVCNDGFSISIQGSQHHYCNPRENVDSYTMLELGYPSKKEKLLKKYAEDSDRPTDTVYPYVPIEVIEEVIIKHKGINVQETFNASSK